MSIPAYKPDSAWPPASEEAPGKLYREWGAWYSGDPEQLLKVYGGAMLDVSHQTMTSIARGGLRGLVQRMWWGRTPDRQQSTTHLHVPIAADLSTFSSDLLYADLPAFRVPAESDDGDMSDDEKRTQAALDKIVDESGLAFVLPESAEIGSAFGGRYVGVRTDVTVSPDSPMFYTVPPDCAVPEWRYGRLTAVTFWRIVDGPNDRKTYRHLERHEVVDGRAMIYHGLFEGGESEIGRPVELTAAPELEALAFKIDGNGGIAAGCSVLDVQYVPNMRPHRLIRGSALGRSDYSGAEPVMDALDEAYSSWQRDIRNGKGRILVPREYLSSLGAGNGAEFDTEREVYQRINALDPQGGYIKPEIVQFAIRTAEHASTCASHVRAIVRAAGLSADAFGEEVNGGAATAKEIGRRGERTGATRAKKINYETYALRMILFAALEQARSLIGGKLYAGVMPRRPDVEFADAAAPDPQTFALTLKALRDAKAASTRTIVEMLHPEWDEERIKAEVLLIDAPAANPDEFDVNGFGGAAGNAQPVDEPVDGDEEPDEEDPEAA